MFWFITVLNFFFLSDALSLNDNQAVYLNEYINSQKFDYTFIIWYLVIIIVQFGVALIYSKNDKNAT